MNQDPFPNFMLALIAVAVLVVVYFTFRQPKEILVRVHDAEHVIKEVRVKFPEDVTVHQVTMFDDYGESYSTPLAFGPAKFNAGEIAIFKGDGTFQRE